jgi:hypothetical protein
VWVSKSMTRQLLFAFFFILSSLSVDGQVLGFSLADGKKRVQIPIEIHNNLVVVPVFLNGALPLKFILDTGVRTAILTEKAFTDILNLPYSRRYTISGPGGAKLVDAYVTNNVSLELPGVTGRGHAMLVLAEDYLELRNYLGTDVHGILGYELFSRFIVQIDYDKKLLTLMLPEVFKPKRKYRAIHIAVEDTKPYLSTEVVLQDGTAIITKLLVDSGASHGLMLEPSSDSRIIPPSDYVSSSIGRGLGGDIVGKVGRVRSLKLADFEMNNVVARFPDPNSYFDSLKMGSTFRNGAIGGEVLSRFSVIFNFPKEEMYLKRASSLRKKFHFNLSGLTIKAKGSGLTTFEVTDVRKMSAAYKGGVQTGDIILSVNGIDAKSLDLGSINGYFNLRPGKQIKLEVNRGGTQVRLKFKLQDEI